MEAQQLPHAGYVKHILQMLDFIKLLVWGSQQVSGRVRVFSIWFPGRRVFRGRASSFS